MANYNILKHSDLTKRGGDRLGIFLDKIKIGSEFLTTKGLAVVDKKQHKLLSTSMQTTGFSALLEAKVNSIKVDLKYPSDFYKTPDFGGKGAGSGTAAEDLFLTKFRDEIEKVLAETKSPYVKVRLGNKRTVKVSSVEKTSSAGFQRDPKSDFTLLDENGNAVGWLSHKAGRKASDFQQYGGLSEQIFSNNAGVKKFMKDLIKMYPKGLPSGVSAYRIVKDEDVIKRSVYGIDYGKQPGPQNVDEFHQGQIKLTKKGTFYVLESVHKGNNGDIPTDDYQAIYFARYTSDRGARVANEFLGNARVGVFPIGKIVRTSVKV